MKAYLRQRGRRAVLMALSGMIGILVGTLLGILVVEAFVKPVLHR